MTRKEIAVIEELSTELKRLAELPFNVLHLDKSVIVSILARVENLIVATTQRRTKQK